MEIRKSHLGKKYTSQLTGTVIEVCEANIPIMVADKKFEFFIVDIEARPLTKVSGKKEVTTEIPSGNFNAHLEISISNDKKFLLDKLSNESLTEFFGRKAKAVKSDFNILGIEYPRNCNLATLAEIIKTLPNDFVAK